MTDQLRRWEVHGPRGAVRFELAELPEFRAVPSVYLHALYGLPGADEFGTEEPGVPCPVTGAEKCWHDALVSRLANATLKAFRDCGQEGAIFADLADYYDLLPDVPS